MIDSTGGFGNDTPQAMCCFEVAILVGGLGSSAEITKNKHPIRSSEVKIDGDRAAVQAALDRSKTEPASGRRISR
jgi:hypothetical protein